MTAAIAFAPLLAPAALVLVGLVARRDPGRRPLRTLAAARLGARLALLGAAGSVLALLAAGPATSPLLGLAGVGLSFRLDALTAILGLLVTFIAAVILRFSRNYLDGDERQGRFLGDLALTAAAALLLVAAGNLVQLAGAWIACTWLIRRLLLFRGDRPIARAAARKMTAIALVADLAILVAAGLMASGAGSTEIAAVLAAAREGDAAPPEFGLAAWLIAVAALLRSVQFPAHVWLPESMESPTPVSALLHAGLVNAGGFLVVRFADLVILAPGAMGLLLVVGGASAVIGSAVMATQVRVKTRLAWSTVAQMGLMVFQCGLGAFHLAVLHILAHSLYKARAFLASGNLPADRPAPATSPRALLGGLLLALGVFAFMALAIGKGRSFGELALALVLVLGLAPLGAAAFAARPRPAAPVAAVAALAAAAGAYLALTGGIGLLLADDLPRAAAPGPFGLAIVAATLLALALLLFLPALAPRFGRGEAWARLLGHLRRGLYVDLLFERLLGRHGRRPAFHPFRDLR